MQKHIILPAFQEALDAKYTISATVVMTVSMMGVLQSVLNKRKIKCACLGDVFNLPLSIITIIGDTLMIGISALLLLNMS